MKPLVKWDAGLLLVLAVAGAALLARQRGTPVQLVQLVSGARTVIVQSVVATGRVNAPARMDIGAEVTATVLEVRVRAGDRVKDGAHGAAAGQSGPAGSARPSHPAGRRGRAGRLAGRGAGPSRFQFGLTRPSTRPRAGGPGFLPPAKTR